MIKLTKFRPSLEGKEEYIYINPNRIMYFEDRWNEKEEAFCLFIALSDHVFVECTESIKYLLKAIEQSK